MFGPDQLEDSARGMARNWMAALAAAIIMLPGVALSEPFRFIRIGDVDGFGFADTSQLVRARTGTIFRRIPTATAFWVRASSCPTSTAMAVSPG